jgi:chemotaxis protein methyltransferase CheR
MSEPARAIDIEGSGAPAPEPFPVLSRPLTPSQFQRLSELLHRVTGIHLQHGKEQLVKARLWKRVHALGLPGFDDYIELVEGGRDPAELSVMVDALSTNKTSFFRESAHFDFLRERLCGRPAASGPVRIWSAGCSSGEEPYTIAMVVAETLLGTGPRDVRLLATDVSTRVLARARAGVYSEPELEGVSPGRRRRFFVPHVEGSAEAWRVTDELRHMIRFAHLNLMGEWPMRGPFDFIFCRNVMIYFDRPTQDRLIGRFRGLLRPGGHLLIGHSESLSGRTLDLDYIQPALYRKPGARGDD